MGACRAVTYLITLAVVVTWIIYTPQFTEWLSEASDQAVEQIAEDANIEGHEKVRSEAEAGVFAGTYILNGVGSVFTGIMLGSSNYKRSSKNTRERTEGYGACIGMMGGAFILFFFIALCNMMDCVSYKCEWGHWFRDSVQYSSLAINGLIALGCVIGLGNEAYGAYRSCKDSDLDQQSTPAMQATPQSTQLNGDADGTESKINDTNQTDIMKAKLEAAAARHAREVARNKEQQQMLREAEMQRRIQSKAERRAKRKAKRNKEKAKRKKQKAKRKKMQQKAKQDAMKTTPEYNVHDNRAVEKDGDDVQITHQETVQATVPAATSSDQPTSLRRLLAELQINIIN